MSETYLIVGAGSSMARAVASRLASEGQALILAGRDVDELERTAADLRIRHGASVCVRRFDALDLDGHGAFFAECVRAAGGKLFGVVVCHGYMADQAEALRHFGEVRRMIDTNYTSAVSLLNLAAEHLEQHRRGVICAVSSVAGDRGRQSNYLYGSTKAALNAYLQGLRNRLARADVAVVTVKPGFVDTRMTWGMPGMFLVASPERVARDVCRAMHRRRHVVYTPWFWWGIMALICAIPERIFKRMKM
jgi:short-subunit dehydrogenase